MKMFYTFGTDERFPFQGGWVEVQAPGRKEAHAAFREEFPDRTPGTLNCSDYYTEEEFLESDMAEEGNRGAFCHRKIVAASTKPQWIRMREDGETNPAAEARMKAGIMLADTDEMESMGCLSGTKNLAFQAEQAPGADGAEDITAILSEDPGVPGRYLLYDYSSSTVSDGDGALADFMADSLGRAVQEASSLVEEMIRKRELKLIEMRRRYGLRG